MNTTIRLLALAVLTTACGGVSDGSELASLNESQAESLCKDLVADYPERTVTCGGDGFEFDLTIGFEEDSCTGDVDSDNLSDSCDLTVGELRDCYDAWYGLSDEDMCSMEELPAECDAFMDCVATEQ